MAPKSTAEPSKKYRQKHKEEYREKDVLQKGNYRQKMKASLIANKERLRLQLKKKEKYWQWVKGNIATATAVNLMTAQNNDSAFSQVYIRSKNIQKVAKTVPKSPKKRKEVISALANKFKLSIKPTQSKARRPKNVLTESEKEWLKNVLDKPNISYVTPGRKDHHMSRNNILCGH